MLKIKQLSFRNFRSYGKNTTTINFEAPGTTLIVGKNDDGGTTNGFGKTSLLHCLTWLLYDKVIDSINKDELINNINKVDMWGECLFSINDVEYVVRRWRKSGKNNKENGVQLCIDEVDVTQSIDETNKQIEKDIGIDFDLFSRIVVFSATNKSFFDLPTSSHYEANQTDMIEQLFDLKSLSQKAQVLKSKIKDIESELKIQNRLIAQASEVLTTHEQLVTKATSRVEAWERDSTEQLNQLSADLELVEHVDFESEQRIHNTLSKLDTSRLELQRDLKLANSHITSTKTKISELQTETTKLADSVCPYCNQHFAGSEHRLLHVRAELDKALEQMELLKDERAQITTDISQINELVDTTKRKSRVDDFNHLVELKTKHQDLKSRLEQLKQQVNPHVDTLSELIASAPTPPNYELINELTSLTDHQQFLLKLLTKKDSFVRKALLHKNIPFLNERLAYYIEQLGLPHTVEFTPSLVAKITQFSRELSFGSLSNGQKARVNFALSLAFSDVLQVLHQRINIQLFDEVLDIGLDTHGVMSASRVLKKKARDEHLSIFIISHRDEVQTSFDNLMVVRQVDGFSQIS